MWDVSVRPRSRPRRNAPISRRRCLARSTTPWKLRRCGGRWGSIDSIGPFSKRSRVVREGAAAGRLGLGRPLGQDLGHAGVAGRVLGRHRAAEQVVDLVGVVDAAGDQDLARLQDLAVRPAPDRGGAARLLGRLGRLRGELCGAHRRRRGLRVGRSRTRRRGTGFLAAGALAWGLGGAVFAGFGVGRATLAWAFAFCGTRPFAAGFFAFALPLWDVILYSCQGA